MKNEEAIQRIEFINRLEYNEKNRIALDMAVDALKKQVSIKPIANIDCCSYKALLCPTCNRLLVNNQLYCDRCGQSIDWSNEDV